MTDGIRILRPGSMETVIDQDYKTLALAQVLTASVFVPTATAVTQVSLGFAGENVLVAVYCTTLEFSINVASHAGTSASYNFYFRSPGGAASETVYFYSFANPVLGSDNYGIKVFDAGGGLVFSNFAKPIRIAAVVPGNSGFSGTPGRIYAPVMLTRSDDVTFVSGATWNIRYAFLRSAGSSIVANMRTMRQGPVRRGSNGSYLAADITGY